MGSWGWRPHEWSYTSHEKACFPTQLPAKWGYNKKLAINEPRSMFSPDAESNGALILDFQASKLWEINVSVYNHPFLSFDNFVITAWMDSGCYWASHLKQWWVLASFLLLMFRLCPHVDLFVPANTASLQGLVRTFCCYSSLAAWLFRLWSIAYPCVCFVCFGAVVILKH